MNITYSIICKTDMISLMYKIFGDIIASKIIILEHPTAKMLKDRLACLEALKFDHRNDWSEWQTLYGWAHIGNCTRHYITYGGGPEGGRVKSCGGGWFAWHRNWWKGYNRREYPMN